ncbi:MAG TPA: hypothetical protein VFW63_04780 [Acidimicrobiales bacterium]|nr:hypothetical protein [Acidimicrobiales bacterium]
MPGRLARWLPAGLALLAVGAAGACHVPPSRETNSYYMARNGSSDASSLGCANSVKTGRMTMLFGAPTTVGGSYGATVWSRPDMPVQDIQETVKNFARGYAYCRSDSSFVLQIGVGTSNSGLDARTTQWASAHGAAWAGAVRDLAAWAQRYHPGVVQVYGAWDPEPSWSSFAKADAWINGYDATSGRRALFVNASADGCSTGDATNRPCNNGWNQWALWHVAWEHDPSLPIPQIYRTDAAQAAQWKNIDLWGTVNRADGIYFYGALAQSGACAQVGGCTGTDNTPHQAHDQLLWLLNSDPRTAQDEVGTMTGMWWNS